MNVAGALLPEPELSLIERPLRSGDAILSFDDKYLAGEGGLEGASRELPADIPDAVAEQLRDIARRAMVALGVRGIARLDFLWDGADGLNFNEINTIPGTMSLYLWTASGYTRRAGRRRPHRRGARVGHHPLAQHRCRRPRPALRGHDRVEVTGSDARRLRSQDACRIARIPRPMMKRPTSP